MNDSGLTLDERQAISDVLHRFYWLVDQGRAAEVVDLFTADASITFGPGAPKPGTISGAEIRPAMAARQAQANVTTRHLLSNIMMERQADGSVAVYSLLTLFRSDDETRSPAPLVVADVNETVVRDKGEWRIANRLISPVFH